jgi:hypothetical protein
MLVEPACGAALCYLYNNRRDIDVDNDDFTSRGSNSSGSNNNSSSSNNNSDSSEVSSQISSHIDHSQISEIATNKEKASVVVIVVCGGSVVSEDLLQQWSTSLLID